MEPGFPGELVNQGHEPELSTFVGLCLNEVVAPDMIAMLRPQADAGSVVGFFALGNIGPGA
jgi:hypothetical protein